MSLNLLSGLERDLRVRAGGSLRRLVGLALVICLAAVLGVQLSGAAPQSPDPDIRQAIASALTKRDPDGLWSIGGIRQSGDWAMAFVARRDVHTGQLLPGELEVALVRRIGAGWTAALAGDPLYRAWLNEAPERLLSPGLKAALRPAATAPANVAGYWLPWPAGEPGWAARHTYPAVDFDIQGYTALGTVRAAKSGQVMFRKDESTIECGYPPPPDCPWQAANILVVRSADNEYVWAMHLTVASIPDWIQEGTWVERGTDVGLEGTTGWTTGPHVHFMVATSYSCCTGSGATRAPYWPTETAPVDFSEAPWSQLDGWFISQNTSPPLLDLQLFVPLVMAGAH